MPLIPQDTADAAMAVAPAAAIAEMESLSSMARGHGYQESMQALRGQMFNFTPSARGGVFRLKE